MKKLMILGAAYSQVPLIQAAKDLGYKTIVTGIKGNYPGIVMADEVCYTDIKDKEAVLKAAQEYKIDGIASCAMDTGQISIGYVCDRMGLCGLTEEAARISTNKYLMKCALTNSGVNTAKFYKVSNTEELKNAIENLAMPLIVKAVDLQGSLGIHIARTRDEVFEGYKKTMNETNKDYCIVEEFIEGEYFGAEAFVYENEKVLITPHGRIPYMLDTEVSIGHYAPLLISKDVVEQVNMQIELAISAIGLNNCAVDADLIVKDGNAYIIEITGRAGATDLPELISTYYGVNYYQMIAMMAVGDDPKTIFNNKSKKYTASASINIISEKSGVVEDIINNNNVYDKNIFDISFDIKKGSHVKKFIESGGRLGKVIVKGDTTDYCLKKIDEILSNIEIIIN